MRVSSTERVRAFRERQRALKLPRKPPKTGAQRAKEFRARKKAIENAVPTEILWIPSADFTMDDVSQTESGPSTNDTDQAIVAITSQCDSRDIRHLYTDLKSNEGAHKHFNKLFHDNPFGYICDICDRLWFKYELNKISECHKKLVEREFSGSDISNFMICQCCIKSLNHHKFPTLSKTNGFKYPDKPAHLPELDPISLRLVSARLPFMQIRRLRHLRDQGEVFCQAINVPTDANTMVYQLPRDISNDYCINVHIQRREIHDSSNIKSFVNKENIKIWSKYLCDSPLYKYYDITVDQSFTDESQVSVITGDEVSEKIRIEDSLTAQQQTLLWNDEKYLRNALSEMSLPQNLFEEHAEELAFPSIYLGQLRKFKNDIRVTPFEIAASELRRADRRGVTPCHLLYVAMKIMRLRIRDALDAAFENIEKDATVTRQRIESEEHINQSIETNFAFLKCIPNSSWHGANSKRDLFAMIRQLGKPTLFLTLTSNEIEWTPLLRILYQLKNDGNDISEEMVTQMSQTVRSSLINEDAVTCAIYFNNLVNVLLRVLGSKKNSPFADYRVVNYFKRIEFEHDDSTRAHILLWLKNAPADPLNDNKADAVKLINKLCSVSGNESSGNINLQKHKHTFACYKKKIPNTPQECHFGAPFLPCKNTMILMPIKKTDRNFAKYANHYANIKMNLDNRNYTDMDSFYTDNGVISDEHYIKILRAGITRPEIVLKRTPAEKYHIPFNPFILNVLQSSTNIQFVLDEYSCADYIFKYINKTNTGISDLQRQIIQLMDEDPEFDIVGAMRKVSVESLNTAEITCREAAWYLLREPMFQSFPPVVYIPTVWPTERQRNRKIPGEIRSLEVDDGSPDIWKENWIDKYQSRPKNLDNVTLAQFVAYYTVTQDTFTWRKVPRIIRYRNYDMVAERNEYMREMVTLHIAFRNEEEDILTNMKFLALYDNNRELVSERKKEFESDLDIRKTIEFYEGLCRVKREIRNDDPLDKEADGIVGSNLLQELYNDENSVANQDFEVATTRDLSTIMETVVDGVPAFYEGRRISTSMTNTQEVFERLDIDKLGTISNQMMDFMTSRKGLTILKLNCRSDEASSRDLTAKPSQQSAILVLSETWVKWEETAELPDFDCIVKFNYFDARTDGVSIRRNTNDKSTAVTPHMDVTVSRSSSLNVGVTAIGESCVARVTTMSGQIIIIIALYISPNKEIEEIVDFLYENLSSYTSEHASASTKSLSKLPMILGGDFGVNFAEAKAQPLLHFFENNLSLKMERDNMSPTNSGSDGLIIGTTINAVFHRYLDELQSRTYFMYLAQYKPVISFLDFDEDMIIEKFEPPFT